MPDGKESIAGIPLAAQMHDHAMLLAGQSPDRYYRDARVFVETSLLVSRYYRFGRPRLTYDVYNVEAEALGQRLNHHEQGMPDIDMLHPLVQSHADLDHLRPPDPVRSGRMPFLLQCHRLYHEMTGARPGLRCCAPFSLAVAVRGYYNLIEDIQTAPQFAHRLLRWLVDEVLVPWIETQREEWGAGAWISAPDAWSSIPTVSLAIAEEYCLPYVLRLRERCGRISASGWWGESYTAEPERYLELKAQAVQRSLQGFDPDVERLGPQLYVDFARSRGLNLVLGIDARLLRDGPPEAIARRVQAYVGSVPIDVPLALSLNNVPPDAPPLHVHTAVSAARLARVQRRDWVGDVVAEAASQESFAQFVSRAGQAG